MANIDNDKELKELANDFVSKMNVTLDEDFNELDLCLIKCHLLIEHSIIFFINKQSKSDVKVEKMRFTFSQKVKICEILGLFNGEKGKIIKHFLEEINSIRNQIAHNLAYDRSSLEKLLNIDINDKSRSISINKHDTTRDKLTYLTSFFCGAIHQSGRTPIIPYCQIKS